MNKLRTNKNTSCIDDMEILLQQIAEFKELMRNTTNAADPAFIQEYRLFKQHVEWVSEDLTQSMKYTNSAN